MFSLKIGAEWLTNPTLVTPSNRNENAQSQLGASETDSDKPFVNVLSQFLKQQERQTTTAPAQINTFIPDLYSVLAPEISAQNVSFNTGNLLTYQPISSGTLNSVLGGKLTGMADTFVDAGERYNVNPALLVAISQHETGNGKSLAAIEKNNIAGMMGANELKSYASIEDSIMDMARNLGNNYLGKGLSSISAIGAKYAPIGAGNDPTGLNNHWVKGVTKYFNQL